MKVSFTEIDEVGCWLSVFVVFIVTSLPWATRPYCEDYGKTANFNGTTILDLRIVILAE